MLSTSSLTNMPPQKTDLEPYRPEIEELLREENTHIDVLRVL